MFLALTCGDAEWSHDVADYAIHSAADRTAWPLTAGMPPTSGRAPSGRPRSRSRSR
ncbi:hypothetical protein NKG05_17200 [Oerskovia sp. M15]